MTYDALRERMERSVETLQAIDHFREERGDSTIGSGIEAYLVGRELNELSHEAVSGLWMPGDDHGVQFDAEGTVLPGGEPVNEDNLAEYLVDFFLRNREDGV